MDWVEKIVYMKCLVYLNKFYSKSENSSIYSIKTYIDRFKIYSNCDITPKLFLKVLRDKKIKVKKSNKDFKIYIKLKDKYDRRAICKCKQTN